MGKYEGKRNWLLLDNFPVSFVRLFVKYTCIIRKSFLVCENLYIYKARFGMEDSEPFRPDIERFGKNHHYDLGRSDAKEAFCSSDKLVTRLVHGTFSPEQYALIIP